MYLESQREPGKECQILTEDSLGFPKMQAFTILTMEGIAWLSPTSYWGRSGLVVQ
jgi:hypothetical protein